MSDDENNTEVKVTISVFTFPERIGSMYIVNAGINWDKWPVKGFVFSQFDPTRGAFTREVYVPYVMLEEVEVFTFDDLEEAELSPPGRALKSRSSIWNVRFIE